MTAHLDDPSLRAFASGALDPAALLAADDHLAGCVECRARAAALLDAATAAAVVLPTVEDGHLTDDEVQLAVSAAPLPAGIQEHLDRCAACRRQVGALREWSTRTAGATAPPRGGVPRTWLLLAASLVAAVSLGWWLAARPAAPGLAGLELLSGAERTRVETMLAGRPVALPAILDDLDGGREVLMGTAHGSTFTPVAPLRTVVAADRPAFTWTLLDGARSYRVLIVDEALAPIAESPVLTGTSWISSVALPRGRTYSWQVTATLDSGTRTTPAPPAPQARFHVLDAGTAEQLRLLQAGAPDAHLVLGVVSAEAGLLDDAVRQLSQVPAGSPHAARARQALDAVEARRRPQ